MGVVRVLWIRVYKYVLPIFHFELLLTKAIASWADRIASTSCIEGHQWKILVGMLDERPASPVRIVRLDRVFLQVP